MPASPFSHVWRRLAKVGYGKPFVDANPVLPSWWDEEMGESQAGFEMTVGLLATRLGLTHESLRDPRADLVFRHDAPVRFKLKNGTVSEEVSASQTFAVQVARLVLKGVPDLKGTSGREPMAAAAIQIRDYVLGEDVPWIDLDALLRWAWGVGIPVVHVDCRRIKGRTMEAMAVRVDGRYAIVLSLNHRSRARLLFHLAHELGHVMLGHLDHDGVIADEGIADGAQGDVVDQDDQEREANAFAVELLTGEARTVYKLGAKARTETLINNAVAKAERDRVHPASIVMLNTQYLRNEMPHINPWGRASRALRDLEPDSDAPYEINQVLQETLQWDRLSEDQVEYLEELLDLEEA